MEKLKSNSGKINLVVIILLIIIAIAGVILTLKITGVIKPEEKDYNNILQNNTSSGNKLNKYNTTREDLEPIIKRTYQTATIMSVVIVIGILVVEIGLNIGICKLYQKLRIPGYIIAFTFIWPILSILQNYFENKSNWFGTFLSITYSVLEIASLYNYFKAVGMSGIWAFMPTISIVLLGFGTAAAISGGTGFTAVLGLIGIVSFIIAYIFSNIKLARIFEKGAGFTVGLVFLPFIFQPILGYSNTDRATYHDVSQ